jgi:alpha-beta hydrolase superfamily lysophospholipase
LARREQGSPCERRADACLRDARCIVVGYSNGGALAVSAALDAIADPREPRADRIVLLSPMIGVTRFAASPGWPAGRRCSPLSPRRPGSTFCRSSTRSNTIRFRGECRRASPIV